jgi:RsiW-degrading membrane proteinase PrsW (M82 family)
MDGSLFLTAMKVGLAWFAVLLIAFRPPLERLTLLARVFVLGMVVCAPAGFFNSHWLLAVSSRLEAMVGGGPGLLTAALLWLLVAPIEEILKYAIVLACTPRPPPIVHAREACLVAACSALGFATYENYHYMVQMGWSVLLVRAWLCPPGHMLWSAIWGYYVGLAWLGRARPRAAVVEGLILASLAHGTYNFLCGLVRPPVGFVVPALAVLLLGRFFQARLWSGVHTPWLARPASTPGGRPGASGPVPVSRRRFGELAGPESQARVAALLARMDDPDAAARAAAARDATGLEDQRTYEKLVALARDPVAEVRREAQAAVDHLRAILARR